MTKQELRDLVDSMDARKLSSIIEKGKRFDESIAAEKQKLNDSINKLKDRNYELASSERKTRFQTKFFSILSVSVLLLILLGSLVGCPRYNVYKETLRGKAEYERAKQNRQIKIEEAKAKNEAAISEAEAKVKMANAKNQEIVITAQGQREADSVRAIGVARANEIIGESLKGNKDYLQFLWIDQLDKGGQKVYIPTEAGLPILEAGK